MKTKNLIALIVLSAAISACSSNPTRSEAQWKYEEMDSPNKVHFASWDNHSKPYTQMIVASCKPFAYDQSQQLYSVRLTSLKTGKIYTYLCKDIFPTPTAKAPKPDEVKPSSIS